jgi:hypothetical protein
MKHVYVTIMCAIRHRSAVILMSYTYLYAYMYAHTYTYMHAMLQAMEAHLVVEREMGAAASRYRQVSDARV